MRRPPLPRPDGLRDSVADRTPDPPAVPTPPTPGRSALRRVATGLLAAGLSLTGLGLLLRYLLGRSEEETELTVTADLPPEPERTWDYDGPRVAPLVGMVGLVVMRFVVERLRPAED